jgi:hypothetical protein
LHGVTIYRKMPSAAHQEGGALRQRVLAVLVLVAVSLGWTGFGHAQGLPSQTQSVVLLKVIAETGAACGYLRPWEAAIVNSIAEQDTLDWEQGRKDEAATAVDVQLAETTCDTPIVKVWIDGARPGIASEYLSLYLIAYSTLLQMQSPPAVMADLVGRDSPDEDIAAIDAALIEMEASGARPDGGGPWPEYIERISDAVRQFAPLLDAGEAPAAALLLIPDAIEISELWLGDVGGAP